MDFGINFNWNQSHIKIRDGTKIAEEIGFDYIWVGENPQFIHPFPIIATIAGITSKITVGCGIISPYLNKCENICTTFKMLNENYGNRFIIGIAPGDKRSLKEVGINIKEDKIKKCISKLKDLELTVFLGAAGPKLLGNTSIDGILLNYVNPEYVKWALKFIKERTYVATYSPSLLLPDRKYKKSLRTAAATVAAGSNKEFQREFNIEDKVKDIQHILSRKDYGKLKKYDSFLLDRFTLSGNVHEINDRIQELRKLGINQTIFGCPMSNNLASIKKLFSIIG